MATTTAAVPTTVATATSSLSDTEWIVIVVVLVIILIVLVIAIAKCLEIGKTRRPKSLLQDAQSAHSETVRSTTTRSIDSTRASRSLRSKSSKMRKLPLNAEITRFSAGRVSRSAEYGVVIRDIKKTVQGEEPDSTHMSPPPSYHEHADTLNTYNSTNNTLSSPPNAQLILNPNQNLAPRNSKAVFAAPEELYAKPYSHIKQQNSVPTQPRVVQPNQVMVDVRYPILNQQAVLLQQ